MLEDPPEPDPLLLPPPVLLVLLVEVRAPDELPMLIFPSGRSSGVPAAHATNATAPAKGRNFAADARVRSNIPGSVRAGRLETT